MPGAIKIVATSDKIHVCFVFRPVIDINWALSTDRQAVVGSET